MLISTSRQSIQKAATCLFSKRTYSSTNKLYDRIVVAVGGNALQRRGERLTIENMLKAAGRVFIQKKVIISRKIKNIERVAFIVEINEINYMTSKAAIY